MMLLIPRLPVPLARILKPQRIAIDRPDLDIQRARQLAVEWGPGPLRRFHDAVVRCADFHLVGIENRDREAVVARVRSGPLVQLVLHHVHAAPAGCVAGGDVLGWYVVLSVSF